MSLFDPLTPEERKRINDIRSGEIIDATPANLQSLLDYIIGKKVDTRSRYPSHFVLTQNSIPSSGSIVFNEIEITLYKYWRNDDQSNMPSRRIPDIKILIQFPNGNLNLDPIISNSSRPIYFFGKPHVYYATGPIRTRILRLINKWKKREGF